MKKTNDEKNNFQKSKKQIAEDYLIENYQFRFNVVKHKPEYINFSETQQNWQTLDEYKLLSLVRELDNTGIGITKRNLEEILFSDFSQKVNPVKDYFNQLQKYTGDKDFILELSKTITVKNSNWYEYLKKWLVSVVANVFIDDYCANHTMLVLTGEQGKFKTTWLESLVPNELKKYNYTGKLNLENKDTLTLISEYFLINIDDQLKQLHKRDENELKNLITINSIKYRRPYDKMINEHPHLASFCASVNGNEFLNDTTGSRRFLPFEIEKIDIDKTKSIDINNVWKQCIYLFKNEFRYWFNADEIDILNKRNEDFNIISIEEELIINFYKPKNSNNYEEIKFLTPTMILIDLELKTKQKLNKKKLGESLQKLNFEKKQRTIDGKVQWTYKIVIKTNEEIERQNNLVEQTIQQEFF
jgi:predicted P-loop ATPase